MQYQRNPRSEFLLLDSLRATLDVSPRELCMKAGVAQSTWSRAASGAAPRKETLEKWKKALKQLRRQRDDDLRELMDMSSGVNL